MRPAAGYSPYVGNEIAAALGLKDRSGQAVGAVIKSLYDAFRRQGL